MVRPCATPLNFRPVLSRNWKDLVNLPSLLVPVGKSKKREGLTYSKKELELPAIVWEDSVTDLGSSESSVSRGAGRGGKRRGKRGERRGD